MSASTSTAPVKGRVKTITVKREGNRWYVVLSCDDVPAEPLEPTGAVVGIDLGIASFLTTSDGEHIPNPRPLAAAADRLTVAQQSLPARSAAATGAARPSARSPICTARYAAARLDHAHKTALTLVRDHDVIAHEALHIDEHDAAAGSRASPMTARMSRTARLQRPG